MNTTTTAETTGWRLVRVYDVRPVDFHTGKRVPVSSVDMDMVPNCHRCDRKHCKVYVVTNGKATHTVGSGCCKRAFGGWEPSKEELRAAREVGREADKAARQAVVTECARKYIAAVAAVVVPAPVKLEERGERGTRDFVEIWGDPANTVHVWCREGFSAERRSAYVSGYTDRAVRDVVNAFPKTIGYYSDVLPEVARLRREVKAA